jgi:hypothetical protein
MRRFTSTPVVTAQVNHTTARSALRTDTEAFDPL